MLDWNCKLKLDSNRKIIGGSEAALVEGIRRGGDLKVMTEFRHNEHIDVASDRTEMIREVSSFPISVLLEDRWVAAFMSLRQPVGLPMSFGPRPSMSFFMYNQDGHQAIARPHLDGVPVDGVCGQATPVGGEDMPKFHMLDSWDVETNAPSNNFIYDFETFEYLVCDSWEEVLSHDADGNVVFGSIDALDDAFSRGCTVKAGIRGLNADLAEDGTGLDHEVFVEMGWCYYYKEEKLMVGASHPLPRAAPTIPMVYKSRNWDFGWLVIRSDGGVVYRRCDPYTLKFSDEEPRRHAIRWFVQ